MLFQEALVAARNGRKIKLNETILMLNGNILRYVDDQGDVEADIAPELSVTDYTSDRWEVVEEFNILNYALQADEAFGVFKDGRWTTTTNVRRHVEQRSRVGVLKLINPAANRG